MEKAEKAVRAWTRWAVQQAMVGDVVALEHQPGCPLLDNAALSVDCPCHRVAEAVTDAWRWVLAAFVKQRGGMVLVTGADMEAVEHGKLRAEVPESDPTSVRFYYTDDPDVPWHPV